MYKIQGPMFIRARNVSFRQSIIDKTPRTQGKVSVKKAAITVVPADQQQ